MSGINPAESDAKLKIEKLLLISICFVDKIDQLNEFCFLIICIKNTLPSYLLIYISITTTKIVEFNICLILQAILYQKIRN